MPILAAAAAVTGLDPALLMVPAVLAASCGFMLPVATGPNALVYGTGLVRARDMIRVGVGLDVVSGVMIFVLLYLLCPWLGWT